MLGRHEQPAMAQHSTALAVQNLWLAARAEGLGVGWVSFFDADGTGELHHLLGLPGHLEVIAYLCVGHVEGFAAAPELATAGWARRRPLAWAVHQERYGSRALPGREPVDLLAETIAAITPPDQGAQTAAREQLDRMTKPRGSLGAVEELAARLAGIAGGCPPPLPEPAAAAVFLADGQAGLDNVLAGRSPLRSTARTVGAEVCLVDLRPHDHGAAPGLLPRPLPAEPAARERAALEIGIEVARDLVVAGNRCLVGASLDADPAATAALAGLILGGAAMGVPVVVDDDGAVRAAAALAPAAADHCVRAVGPVAAGAVAALLTLPVLVAAARTLHDVATFDAAGVADKQG